MRSTSGSPGVDVRSSAQMLPGGVVSEDVLTDEVGDVRPTVDEPAGDRVALELTVAVPVIPDWFGHRSVSAARAVDVGC